MSEYSLILLVLFSMLLYSLSSVLSKFIIENLKFSYHFLILQSIIGCFVLIILLFFEILSGLNISTVFNSYFFLLIVFSGIFTFIGTVTLFKGIEVGNVSASGVILSSRAFISIPLAIIFFNEIYPVTIYIGIIVILIGSILASWAKDLSIFEALTLKGSGGRWFILTDIFWALGNAFIRDINNDIPVIIIITLSYVIYLVLSLILYNFLNPQLGNNQKPKYTKKDIMHSSMYIIMLLTANFAFVYVLGQSLTIAEGLVGLQGIFTFIIVIVLALNPNYNKSLKEPLDKKILFYKVTGTCLAFTGVLLLLFL